MKAKTLFIIAALTFSSSVYLQAQTNLTGRTYQNPNIMKDVLDKAMDEINLSEAKAEAIKKAEKEKGRKLTKAEEEKLDGEVKKAQELIAAMKKGMTTAITVEFKDEKQLIMRTKMHIDENALKMAGVGWAKRKALKAAMALAPESEKASYTVKDNLVIMTDDKSEKDTLRMSKDGKYLYGKMDEKTKFTLTRIK